MVENAKCIISQKNIKKVNNLSRDLHYEKFISKMIKDMPNLDKNVLLYTLVNNLIDQNGLWLEFGESKYNNTNRISHYSKNKIFSFKEPTSEGRHKENENVEVIEGEFSKTIPSFKNKHMLSKNLSISFLCINCNSRNLLLQILFNLYKNISNNCIIIFDKLINFHNCEKLSLKALYEFFNIYKINYEWLGMDGYFSKTTTSSNINTNNKAVGIRILNNPFLKKKGTLSKNVKPPSPDYDIFDWEKYVSEHKDLNGLLTKDDAWNHWLNHGIHENRMFFTTINENNKEETFDWEKYISSYEDLNSLNSKEDAWNHWLNHGLNEGRTFFTTLHRDNNTEVNFDWKKYASSYNDLNHLKSKEEAWNHWLDHGKNECREFFRLS